MTVVGLTGGIGSGKSTVAKVFKVLGIPIFNSDIEAKRLMTESPALKSSIIDVFGEKSYNLDGTVNRTYLSEKVFNDNEALTVLNGLVHPAVGDAFDRWVSVQKTPYCIKEAAILFESGAHKQCDSIIAVTADDDIRLERVMKRDQVSRDKVLSRMQQQWPQEEVRAASDHHINNSGDVALIPQIIAIHKLLSRSS
ncbi:MAG: dephospho-CoA kinase [Salibacteraceae bacterium]